jgi:tight adherence protein B
VIQDEQLGVPLEEGLEVVVRRMQNRDLEQVAVVASLQRHTGGNTAEVLDRVTETVRERGELRRLVRTLTAQGRLSRWVVSFLPVGVLIMLTIINPGFTEPLFTELVGRIMLAVAATMVVIGSLVIKKIIEIEV